MQKNGRSLAVDGYCTVSLMMRCCRSTANGVSCSAFVSRKEKLQKARFVTTAAVVIAVVVVNYSNCLVVVVVVYSRRLLLVESSYAQLLLIVALYVYRKVTS